MLRRLHHHELAEEEGMLAVHQIANKADSLIGVATVDLVDPRKVKFLLEGLLLNKGSAFDLTDDQAGPPKVLFPLDPEVAGAMSI